jgi:hypothetical protein
MAISPGDVIEQIVDDIAMGELGQSTDSFAVSRIDDGTLLLDYGASGKFTVAVTRVETTP